MPTIDFSLKDLSALVGKKLTPEQVEQLVEYGKGELKSFDKETDTVSVNFDDTNLPYLWSVEGVAILVKGVLGIEKGIPKLKIEKTNEKIIVNKNISKIRPYIAAFSAKGKKVDDYLIKQIIQLQEKLCDSYGRKRRKVAIGVYPHSKIKFPVSYKAVNPKDISFVPLESQREMNLSQILARHPTGIKYAFTLEGFKEYPILVDSNKQVLSFPPIINSENLGKVEIGAQDLFVEVTGTDFEAVNLCANIFAAALSERGFKICSTTTEYPGKKVASPLIFNEKIR
ncbi:phenylalanine--tRNA ligase subunit beta, partial [Candidatus Woesearchaeota archaeon]|nr:phenylalanine--tRNA ligase subunit beta [Candidatus Woesearchaeota archaeon]